MLHVCHEVSGWPNNRAWEQIVDIWPILLEFGPINDLLLFFTDRRWCKSLAKLTKQVKIEKSKLFFVIPKTILVIPYPDNFSVGYPLSLKLFCQSSLIPKTPNRASSPYTCICKAKPALLHSPVARAPFLFNAPKKNLQASLFASHIYYTYFQAHLLFMQLLPNQRKVVGNSVSLTQD